MTDIACAAHGSLFIAACEMCRRAMHANVDGADAVDHPAHYKARGIEAIDVIEAFGLNFRLGNTVKYILRAGRKGATVEDLKKARWYLDREIEKAGTNG